VASGSVVVQELCYKTEGRGFETRGGERVSSIYFILPAVLGRRVYSASNRNKYQKQETNISGDQSAAGAQGRQPTYLHLRADCLDNMESSTSHNPIRLHNL
jgi:hypothetical protein